jgi:hypothetical protein
MASGNKIGLIYLLILCSKFLLLFNCYDLDLPSLLFGLAFTFFFFLFFFPLLILMFLMDTYKYVSMDNNDKMYHLIFISMIFDT